MVRNIFILFFCINMSLLSQVMTYRDPCIYSQGVNSVSIPGIIPNMTDYTIPSGQVLFSTENNTGSQAWHAFNSDSQKWFSISSISDDYVEYNFGTTVSISSWSGSMGASSIGASSFTAIFEYSNDNSSWTTLSSDNVSGSNSYALGISHSFSTITARYFRWRATAKSASLVISGEGLQVYP